jgi:type I restriction enzyme M protein
VGAEAQEDDGEPFEGELTRLVATLGAQEVEAARLDAAIACARLYRRPYLRDRPWK